MNTIQKEAYLPLCVRKKELRNYFGETYEFLWANIITEELLEEWGSSYEAIRYVRAFTPELTQKIYVHFEITDLNEPNSARIQKIIQSRKT